MIIGTGNDLIDIRRIEKSLDRFGERFIQRVFTEKGNRPLGTQGPARCFLCQTVCRQGGLFQGSGDRAVPWRFLAGYGREQSLIGQTDHGFDQWGA